MKLLRQVLGATIAGGLCIAATLPAAAQTYAVTPAAPPVATGPMAVPAPYGTPDYNANLAASTVAPTYYGPTYPETARPVRRNPFGWMWHQPLVAEGPRESFAITAPGYMGEQNARP